MVFIALELSCFRTELNSSASLLNRIESASGLHCSHGMTYVLYSWKALRWIQTSIKCFTFKSRYICDHVMLWTWIATVLQPWTVLQLP